MTWNPNDPCFDWKGPCFGGFFSPKIEEIHRFQVYDIYRSLYMNISINTWNLFVLGFGKVVPKKKSPPIKTHSRITSTMFPPWLPPRNPRLGEGMGALFFFFHFFCKRGHKRVSGLFCCRCHKNTTCEFVIFFVLKVFFSVAG